MRKGVGAASSHGGTLPGGGGTAAAAAEEGSVWTTTRRPRTSAPSALRCTCPVETLPILSPKCRDAVGVLFSFSGNDVCARVEKPFI